MERDLREIIDVNMLQSVLDNFSKATGMASVAVASNGDNLTRPSCFTEFCIDRTRGTQEGLRRCINCDVKGGEESARTGRPAVYFCHAGLMDFGAPIIIDGELVGSVLGGQVLPKEPDPNKFIQIAREIGIDEAVYLSALSKIPVVPEGRIRAAAELLYIIVNEMASRWTQLARIEKQVMSVSNILNEIHQIINNFSIEFDIITKSQTELSMEIQQISDELLQINGVVKSVGKIADNTRMLGFNASIEAARAGAAGSGFAVVAREIGSLSDKSKETINEIQDFTQNIEKSIDSTTKMSKINQETLMKDKESITIINQKLEELKDNFETLYKAVKETK